MHELNQNKISKTIIVVFLSLVFGLGVASQIFNTRTPKIVLVFGVLGLVTIGSCLVYFIVLKRTWLGLTNYSLRTRIIWIAICMLAGYYLVFTIPLTVYPQSNIIKIIATGRKDPRARGSEVWLANISSDNKTSSINLSDICVGNWETKENIRVSYPNRQPSELICTVKADDVIVVRFGMHPWSGKVKLDFDDQNIEENLYSEVSSSKEITFQIQLEPRQTTVRNLLFIFDGIWLGILLLALSVWLATRSSRAFPFEDQKSIAWLYYALPLVVTWIIYLLAFWPGLASNDTFNQLDQIVSGQYNNWHPVFHTWLMFLITRVWFSISAVILVQIVAMSIIWGWSILAIRRLGAPKWLSWLVLIWLIALPSNGFIAIIPWKDIAYSLSALVFTIIVLKIVSNNGKSLSILSDWIVLSISGALIALFRHNGWPVTLFTLLILTIVYRKQMLQSLGALILSIGLWLIIIGPIFHFTGVNTKPINMGKNPGLEAEIFHFINFHYKNGASLLPEEKNLIDKIYPLIKNLYTDIGWVEDWSTLTDNTNQLLLIAVNLTFRHPGITFQYLLNKTAYTFQIIQPSGKRIDTAMHSIANNSLGVVLESKLPKLKQLLVAIKLFTEQPSVNWIVWRNAFWMDLFLFSSAIACLRVKSWKYLLVPIPMLLNVLPLTILVNSQSYRLIIFTVWVSALLSGYLLLIPNSIALQDKVEDIPL
jgi:hypothetical protein